MANDWEYPLGDPRHRDRNMSAYPYSHLEARVAEYLPFGGGDDPLGFLICSHQYTHTLLKAAIKRGIIPANWQELTMSEENEH
jgi:hypothetical protein